MPRKPNSPAILQGLGKRITECEKIFWGIDRYSSLAVQLGIDAATMSNYRLGKTMPPITTLSKLAKMAKVHLDWLALGEGERDLPNSEQFVVDKRSFATVSLLDVTGAVSSDSGVSYISKEWLRGPLPRLGVVDVACFRIIENLQGQKYPDGTLVLLDLSVKVPRSGWFCLKGPTGSAYVREIDLDVDGTIELLWPRSGRPAEVKRYSTNEFAVNFSVIGQVLGTAFGG